MRWWAIAAMAGLAALDLAGACLAKELSARPRFWMYAIAIGIWVLLFVVYVWSMRFDDLWVVTFGWITMLQVGVLLIDRFMFGTEVSARKWALAAALVVVQIGLLLPEQARHETPARVDPAVVDLLTESTS